MKTNFRLSAVLPAGLLIAGSIVCLQGQGQPAPPPPANSAPPQQWQGGPGGAPGGPRGGMMGGGMMGRRGDGPPPPNGGGPERMLQAGPGGRWWSNPDMAQKIGINSDQQKKMDDIFQANRLRLIDLTATLQKEEIILDPLLRSDTPDEPKILAQIDKVAQGRAELEKANARFLLGIRRVLTPEQWKKLQAERPAGNMGGAGGPGGGPDGGGGRRGPGGPGGRR